MARDDKDNDRLYCEIVAQLLIADAAVTDDERAFLEKLFDRFEFSAEDRQAVFNSVDIGQPVDDRLAKLDAEHRGLLVQELEQAALADGEIGPAEAAIIDQVKQALQA